MFSRQLIQLLFAALFIFSAANAQSNHVNDALGRRIDSVLVALEQKGFAGSILIKFKEHIRFDHSLCLATAESLWRPRAD